MLTAEDQLTGIRVKWFKVDRPCAVQANLQEKGFMVFMVKYVSFENLTYYTKKLNKRLNDLFATGLHTCNSCGAPYKGQPVREYCGRSFFVDTSLFHKGVTND